MSNCCDIQIIRLKTILRPLDPNTFDDIYVISELMETDLSSIIKSPQPLSDAHVQFFLYQILRGLKYIHSSNVIHRDLKPRNLLVNSNCDLKICDFGLARVDFAELQWKVAAMTDYVATRWYRAPEVILSWKKYTKAIDMWSVGCILAELVGRKPIFPGSDSQHQLQLITEIVGSPSEHTVANIKQEKALSYLKQLPQREPMDFSELYPDANVDALDLLEKLLEFDPADRITVEEALAHPYLKALHFPEDEPSSKPVSRKDFEFERSYLTCDEIRELILGEIMRYGPDGLLEEEGGDEGGVDIDDKGTAGDGGGEVDEDAASAAEHKGGDGLPQQSIFDTSDMSKALPDGSSPTA